MSAITGGEPLLQNRNGSVRFKNMIKKISLLSLAFLLVVSLSTLAVAQEEKKDEEKIKVSGEVRVRLEGRDNYTGVYNTDTNFSTTLARTRLNILATPDSNLEAFIQLQDSRTWGSEASTLSDSNNVDLHQAWFIYKNIGESKFSLKVGRQELVYGDERLIGAVGWHNVGRAFDGAKLVYKDGDLQVDGFITTTVETFAAGEDSMFAGIYATANETPLGTVDVYALVKSDDRNIYFSEIFAPAADLMINTFGVRIAGAIKDTPFSYGGEFAFQTGDFGKDDHEAYACHLRAAYLLGTEAKIKVNGEFNFASGDDNPNDGKHESFDNLFPTNHGKYGYMDFIGWKNIKNFKLGISAVPFEGHTLAADYHLFYRANTNDNVYQAGGAAILQVPANIDNDDIGQEIDLTWNFSPAKGLGVLAGYSHFFAGELFELSRPGEEINDADFFYLQSSVRF